MAFDTLIKKFFPVITGLVLALIAYFQASGVVELVSAGALATNADEIIGGSLGGRRPGATQSESRKRSAQPIIDRNPFDSETDLNPPPPEPSATEIDEDDGPPQSVDLSDPLAAEPCDGVKLHIVTESADPEWSVALMQTDSDDNGSLFRVGDEVDGMEVAYIGFNRQEASPAVWMVKERKLCQALLFSEEQTGAKRKPAPPKPPATTAAKPAPKPPKRGAPKVPDEIASKIEKVSDTEFNVDRGVIDNILENQATLMRSARIVPEKGADGKTVGIRLFGIRGDTLLGTLGLQNGDRLETINGFNMASPEDALNAYARLRTANKLAVKVTRRGKPMNIDFNIK